MIKSTFGPLGNFEAVVLVSSHSKFNAAMIGLKKYLLVQGHGLIPGRVERSTEMFLGALLKPCKALSTY